MHEIVEGFVKANKSIEKMRLKKEYQEKLKNCMKVYMRKYPGANLEQMKEFTQEGNPTVFDNVQRQTVKSLLCYIAFKSLLNMDPLTTDLYLTWT